MANYTVNEKNKRIIVSASLTDIEKEIISLYIGQGYVVKEKKASSRILAEDITRWFSVKNDAEGLEKFNAEKERIIKDKNENDRKAGYLVAVKWFKKTYPEAIKEIKEMKKKY